MCVRLLFLLSLAVLLAGCGHKELKAPCDPYGNPLNSFLPVTPTLVCDWLPVNGE